jgi:hypothetical protein
MQTFGKIHNSSVVEFKRVLSEVVAGEGMMAQLHLDLSAGTAICISIFSFVFFLLFLAG